MTGIEMSFLESPFDAVTSRAPCDLEMYNRITNGITDLTAILAGLSDQAGNLSLGATKTIKWGGSSYISWSSPNVVIDTLELPASWAGTTINPGGDCNIADDLVCGGSSTLTLSGNLTITGIIDVTNVAGTTITLAQIAEPADPTDNGRAIMWCSNGTGVGDPGDIMIKIKWSDTVKTKTLVNHS